MYIMYIYTYYIILYYTHTHTHHTHTHTPHTHTSADDGAHERVEKDAHLPQVCQC